MPLLITAQNDYIIAKPVKQEDESGLSRVDSNPKKQKLEVVAAGPEVDSCKIGDNVLPFGSEFQAFEFENEQYLVLRNDQIIGVMGEDAE